MLYREAEEGEGGKECVLVQVGTPSPGDGAAHIQGKPCLFLERPSESLPEVCFHGYNGNEASHLASDMNAALHPGVILLKQTNDSDNLHSTLSQDS
jgi:hypothetical protein